MRFQLPADNASPARARLARRHVERAQPPSRIMRLRGQWLRFRSLFSRRPSADLISHGGIKSGPIAESAQLINLLSRPRLPVQKLLAHLHHSAATNHHASRSGDENKQIFSQRLHDDLNSLSDRQLFQIHNRINGKRMMRLRGALRMSQFAGLENLYDNPHKTAALHHEFAAMGESLASLGTQCRRTLLARGFHFSPAGRPLGISSPMAGELAHFGRRLETAFTANADNMPQPLQGKLLNLAARDSQPAFEEPFNPASGLLPVANDFFRHYAAQNIRLHGEDDLPLCPGDLDQNDFDLGDEDMRRAVSDGLLQLCDGNESQTLRLSSLLSRDLAYAPRQGLLAADNNTSSNSNIQLPNGQKPLYFSQRSQTPAFTLRRLENGDVAVHLTDSADLHGASLAPGESVIFNRKKSNFACRADFIVPAQENAPVSLNTARFNYQIFNAQNTAEDPTPAAWMHAV